MPLLRREDRGAREGGQLSVWLCIPSARPSAEANVRLAAWRAMGYKIALFLDSFDQAKLCDKFAVGAYPGYAQAVNRLAKIVLAEERDCDWIVCAGDDTFPDFTKRADEIAAQCRKHFYEKISSVYPLHRPIWAQERWCPEMITDFHLNRRADPWATFGVMQPTGDPWSDHMGRIIERIAGSPFLGREWCLRANQGAGPLWPEYTHCYADEELQNVATRLGVFWQRPDLTHAHQNWARATGDARDMPAFLTEANSPQHWAKYGALFRARKAAGFPGSEPL